MNVALGLILLFMCVFGVFPSTGRKQQHINRRIACGAGNHPWFGNRGSDYREPQRYTTVRANCLKAGN